MLEICSQAGLEEQLPSALLGPIEAPVTREGMVVYGFKHLEL